MTRPGLIVALIALIGCSLSALASLRFYDQERLIERGALERAVESHARLAQERMSERELLARVAVGLFRPPSALEANALQPLRSSLYTFKTDFVLASWIARVPPDDFSRATESLTTSGFRDPILRHNDNSPLDQAKVTSAVDVIMDVEPRTSLSLDFAGRSIDIATELGRALREATVTGKPVASNPVALLNDQGLLGIVLAAPVFSSFSGNQPIGFITFSYRLAPLLLTTDSAAPFVVSLRDPRQQGVSLVTDKDGRVRAETAQELAALEPFRASSIAGTVQFGSRDWQLLFTPKQNLTDRAAAIAGIVGLIGLVLTAALCSMFGYVAFSNLRLQREIEARLSYESRLGAVMGELNHRVKNILAVIQSIVTRTLRSSHDLQQDREMLIGRIHAMSSVVSLLSDSQWQGVKLRSLLEARSMPHFDNGQVLGPDVTVSSRAAQSLSLLFFELASHAGNGSLDQEQSNPNIVVQWQVEGQDKDAVFHLRWEEFNSTPATRREENDFGTVLLDRVTPEAVGGTSKRYFTDVSYVYELTAPMESVIDRTELDRTMRFALPTSQ